MVLRLLLLLAAMATATASAQTLETRAALEQIQAHRRVASAYLHRLLIEQRSFERLLSFRFG